MSANSVVLQKIDQTRDFLFQSPMDEIEKDGLIDQLNAAQNAVQVSTDPALSELVALRTCAEIKHAIRLPSIIDKAVHAHAVECKNKQPPVAKPAPVGPIAIILDLLHVPWFWLFACVAVFSPNFPSLLETIKRFIK